VGTSCTSKILLFHREGSEAVRDDLEVSAYSDRVVEPSWVSLCNLGHGKLGGSCDPHSGAPNSVVHVSQALT